MNTLAAKMSLMLILLSCSFLFSAYASDSEESRKIIVIYKASTKDPAVKLTLDGKENGSLTGGTYMELPTDNGKHLMTAGVPVQQSYRCYIGGAIVTSTSPVDHIQVNFRPASITIDVGKTVYILVERYKPATVACNDIGRFVDKFTNYRLQEINPEKAEKLTRKYRPAQ